MTKHVGSTVSAAGVRRRGPPQCGATGLVFEPAVATVAARHHLPPGRRLSGTVRVAFFGQSEERLPPHRGRTGHRARVARMTGDVGCVLLTGNGRRRTAGGPPSARQRPAHPRPGRIPVRRGARRLRPSTRPALGGYNIYGGAHRLIQFMPKVVICVVPGWAAGGGHSLHVVCATSPWPAPSAPRGSSRPTPKRGRLRRRLRRPTWQGRRDRGEIFFLGETLRRGRRAGWAWSTR